MQRVLLRVSSLLVFLLIGNLLFAQQRTVNGTIINEETKEPVAGATVSLKGTERATTTNAKGQFSILVSGNESVLRISSVGYGYQEVTVGASNSVQIGLKSEAKQLEDVVVIGYGTQKAKDVTAAAVAVDPKKLEDLPVPTLTEALRGQVPGLSVSGGSGRPGIAATLSIRQQVNWGKDGGGTIPLIVIDDVIQVDPNTGQPSLDQFNMLDISEVESITVLKDAAAAIYGSRASQGAIIVRTKRGKAGPPKITYYGKFERMDAVSFGKTMNAYEYGIFSNRFGRAAGWSANKYFDSSELEQMKTLNYDWLKEAWKAAGTMQHSLTVSGGSDRATYFAGASYYTQGANMGSQDFNRWTFRSGTDVKVINNLKLSATVSANNSAVDKSFTKLSINDGGYGSTSEQNDYKLLAHMPKYIPWIYNVNGVDQYISPSLGPNRPLTTPVGQNNIAGWNYFAMLNNGSHTNSGDFAYNTNFSLQYDVPFVKGLSLRGSYGLSYSTSNTEQVSMPQTLAISKNSDAVGSHLYGPNTSWFVGENKNGARVSYSDAIGKIRQSDFFVNYDNSFGLHNISALAGVERSEQDYQKKFVIYDTPISGGYNGASTTAGTLNTSNTYVSRTEGGSLSYLGRISYNYNSKYLLQFVFRSDASTHFAPENYWGFFPSVSAGWVISRENWFKDRFSWIDNLKFRVSIGKTGNDNIKPWKWMQTYAYAADKGFGFGTNGGVLVAGVTPDATPNRNVTWDQDIKQNYGLDLTVLRGRLSITADHYVDHVSNILTAMSGMVGVPISVGGAFAEQNFGAFKNWGSEYSVTWRDHIRKLDYSIGVNFGHSDNKVTKYFAVPFDYPAANLRQEGYSTFFPSWGFQTWKGNAGGDGLLRTDADIDAYWNYLTNLATKAGTTPSYLGITTRAGIKKGMLAYQDLAGDLNANSQTIAGPNGRVSTKEDYAELTKANNSYGFTTNMNVAWKGINLSAQVSTSWGGNSMIDYVKQGTSSGQMFWSHESYLTDMFDTLDNVNGKYPNLAYYDQNGLPSDFWKISSFRCYVRSMTVGYSLPKDLSRRLRMENLRLTLSGYNLWSLTNPYPDHYRNIYDSPTVDYPTLRTWALGINATF